MLDRLGQRLPCEEFVRVLEIFSSEEEHER